MKITHISTLEDSCVVFPIVSQCAVDVDCVQLYCKKCKKRCASIECKSCHRMTLPSFNNLFSFTDTTGTIPNVQPTKINNGFGLLGVTAEQWLTLAEYEKIELKHNLLFEQVQLRLENGKIVWMERVELVEMAIALGV